MPETVQAKASPLVTPSSRAHAAGFWIVAAAFATLMAFATLPTPLWPLYAARDHLDAVMVTVAFAVLVVGAAMTFPLLGHLSDRFGRRRIAAPALAVATAASVILAVWPQTAGLLAGRFLTGIGIGLMASTATAYLHDLHATARPDRAGSHMPALVASAANLGGLALGPLVAGILAQWAPAPLLTPYVLFAIAMAVLLALILASPETVDTALTDRQPARFALLEGDRPLFVSAAALGFIAFAVIGLFSALGAIIFREQLGVTSLFVAALAPFSVFAASAVAQLALAQVLHRTALLAGIVLLALGMALTVQGINTPTLALLLTGVSVAGAGAGLLFRTAVGLSAAAAQPSSRAGVLAVFFAIAYIGMGAPPIAFSIVEHAAGRAATMVGFGLLMAVAAALAAIVPVRRSRPAAHRRPASGAEPR